MSFLIAHKLHLSGAQLVCMQTSDAWVLSDEALAGSIQVICQGWQIGGIEISG